jgi:para-nitrobenzyl esterase
VLNIWRPANASKNLPVMVWIYGGGFVNGGSSPAVYDGTHFAKYGVMLVSFNYRVGRFGFFAHPALTKEAGDGLTGNFGYMDQIAALRWVQRNISGFGGDPRNVTIFGESAGGYSVHMLLTSPLTNGLFQKAVVESGGGRMLLAGSLNLADAEAAGVAFARSKGATGEGPVALMKLRGLPAAAVVSGLNLATMRSPDSAATFSGTMIDGKIVIEQPQDVYRAGREKRVPIIVGANSHDIGFPSATSKGELFAQFGRDAKEAAAVYDPSGSAGLQFLAEEVAADEMMVEPARFVVRSFSAIGLLAWEYRFSYVPEQIRQQVPGMLHAEEIPFVFNTVAEKYAGTITAGEQQIARLANHAWAQFAKTGDPNGDGLSPWPSYSMTSDSIMDFSNEGPHAVNDPWKARLDLIEKRLESGSDVTKLH